MWLSSLTEILACLCKSLVKAVQTPSFLHSLPRYDLKRGSLSLIPASAGKTAERTHLRENSDSRIRVPRRRMRLSQGDALG